MQQDATTRALQAQRVVAGYRPDQTVLHGVDLALQHGELLCILGPNGSGKSTLLRCLLGLLPVSSGQVIVAGQDASELTSKQRATSMAYVPQRSFAAFSLTVREVVLTGRFAHGGMLGLAGQADREASDRAMERCGVTSLSGRLFEELSGGEAQCVMIARALAQQTRIVLLDEPTSHLDLKNQTMIYELMQSLARDNRLGVLCVSHDVNLASRFADRLVMMNHGKVVTEGKPAAVLTEANLEATYQTPVELLKVERHALPLVVAKMSRQESRQQ